MTPPTLTGRRVGAALGTLALASSLTAIGWVTPVDAALTTTCRGTAGAVTVPGDLVVPAGAACDLSGTSIEGNVTVRAGATLLMDGVDVEGNLLVQADGYAEARATTVAGTTRLVTSFGMLLEDSELSGAVTASTGGFFYGTDSSLGAPLRSSAGETVLETVQVDGSVTTLGDVSSDLYDSTIAGDVSFTDALNGSAVCSSEVDGRLAVLGASGPVSIGDPVVGACGPTYVGGDLTLRDNSGGVRVTDSIVRGSTRCVGNEPPPILTDNRFRGEATGQCSIPISPLGARGHSRSVSFEPAAKDRLDALLARAAERAGLGAVAAAAEGDAGIATR